MQIVYPDHWDRYGYLITSPPQDSNCIDGAPAGGESSDGDGIPVLVQIAEGEMEQLVAGIGWVDEIYAVVERDHKLYLARGGVYSTYEFTSPITDTLTDTRWPEILAAGKQPARPVWTQDFIPE